MSINGISSQPLSFLNASSGVSTPQNLVQGTSSGNPGDPSAMIALLTQMLQQMQAAGSGQTQPSATGSEGSKGSEGSSGSESSSGSEGSHGSEGGHASKGSEG